MGDKKMTRMKKELNEANIILNRRIASNLNALLSSNNISKGKLCENLNKMGKISMDRTTLSKILNHPDEYSISLPFLVACAEYFNVPVDLLLRNDNCIEVLQDENIESVSEKAEKSQIYFVSNPNHPFWEQYLQKYYCYYYSTIAEENRKEDSLMAGTLEITNSGSWCKAEMKIDTKKYDKFGEKIYKTYVGNAILCPATGTIQCNMRENNIGDCCYIVFRYVQVNYTKQACRMAEVLSTSSKPERRYPVVHKMILSKEKINDKDWNMIKPHLYLNYSKIIVGQKGLEEIGQISDVYSKIVKEIKENHYEPVKVVKERTLREIAEKYLSQEEVLVFVTEVRSKSLAYRYNKISQRVDLNLWEMLRNLGYFKDEI